MAREYFRKKAEILADGKKPRHPPPFYLCFAAIVKNEGPYLAEWIEFHRIVGVEKFFIYDNESTDGTREILEPYIRDGIVDYTFWPGQAQQMAAYKDALERHKDDARWIGFIDIDEFAVPVAGDSVAEIMREFEGEAAVCANWLVYGDNGHARRGDGLVIERFTAHAKDDFYINRQIKSFVDPRRCVHPRVHTPLLLGNTPAVNTAGGNVAARKTAPVYDRLRINHYWGKSFEEWQVKKFRGDVITANAAPKPDASFHLHNRNEVAGDRTMERFVPPVKAALASRKKPA